MTNDAKRKKFTPYIGVRAYGIEDSELFAGRDADVASVADLIADKDRWRIILLHGLTGAGKSSFLKAGLIPEVTLSVNTTVFTRSSGDTSYSLFITSTDDPMSRLAEAALELVRTSVPEQENEQFFKSIKPHATDWTQAALARSAPQLASLFAALAPRLNQPLLLIIDQAEELFTIRSGAGADEFRECYFDFLAEFCCNSSWIQLLLSMRTEFYGRFDAELRRRIGPSVAFTPYFLRSLTAPILEQVVKAPCEFTFFAGDGMQYTLHYEEGLPQRIAKDLERLFPGPGALTCLQIVCSRLAERAVKDCFNERNAVAVDGPRMAVISHSMYTEMGTPTNAIEDVIDQTLGTFCDSKRLLANDAVAVWKAGKQMLGSLVVQQAEGVPVTTFMLRDHFVVDMTQRIIDDMSRVALLIFPRLYSFGREEAPSSISRMMGRNVDDVKAMVEDLVNYLLARESRILRALKIVKTEGEPPSHFVALGHDVLAVGIAEFNARTDWFAQQREQEARQLRKRLVLIPIVFAFLSLGALLLFSYFHEFQVATMDLAKAIAYSVVVGVYCTLLYSGWVDIKARKRPGSLNPIEAYFRRQRQPLTHMRARGSAIRLFSTIPLFRVLLSKLPNTGHLFREMTTRERLEHSIAGHSAFPGGPRY